MSSLFIIDMPGVKHMMTPLYYTSHEGKFSFCFRDKQNEHPSPNMRRKRPSAATAGRVVGRGCVLENCLLAENNELVQQHGCC
jgi:hypothetical protein